MSLKTTTTVSCDGCNESETADTSGAALRRDMEKRGWVVVKNQDWCSQCNAKRISRLKRAYAGKQSK